MTQILSREIRLARRPAGLPQPDDFGLARVPVSEPGPGQVLVRNIYMSVDPYMRGRMRDRESYVPSFRLDEPMTGGCVGRVVRSQHDGLQAGDYVLSQWGWREYYVDGGAGLTKIDPDLAPIQAYLGVMGMPGLTAYVGLLDIGQIKEDETVFVTAASGAVGSVACQIARIRGCRVVGSAGSQAKLDWLLNEAGIDAALNYKQVDDLAAALRALCPQGIDVDFENVGGAHLEAAIANMNRRGRVVLCGTISTYNAEDPQPGPRNLFRVITERLTIQGFIVSDHYDRRPQFLADMSGWIRQGQVKWQETIVEGLENAPQAFISLFTGDKMGKVLVKIGPDPTAG